MSHISLTFRLQNRTTADLHVHITMSVATGEELVTLCRKIGHMSKYRAVQGKKTSDHRSHVLEQTTSAGDVVAVKVWAKRGANDTIEEEHDEYGVVERPPLYNLERTEAEMSE